MRYFVRQSIKSGRVCSFNQYYKSKICGNVLKIISEALGVKGSVSDNIEAYYIYKKNQYEIFKKEYESQFNDYRDGNEKEKEKNINENLSNFPIHQLSKQITLNDFLRAFDAASLYPSTMSDEK